MYMYDYKPGFIRLAYRIGRQIVPHGHQQAGEQKEPVTVQSKKLEVSEQEGPTS